MTGAAGWGSVGAEGDAKEKHCLLVILLMTDASCAMFIMLSRTLWDLFCFGGFDSRVDKETSASRQCCFPNSPSVKYVISTHHFN